MPKHYTIKTVHAPLKGNKLLPWGIFGGLFCLLLIDANSSPYGATSQYTVEAISGIFTLTLLSGLTLEFKIMRFVFYSVHALLIILYLSIMVLKLFTATHFLLTHFQLGVMLFYSAMTLILFLRFIKKLRSLDGA